jgi:hypothetical protein
MVLTSLKKKNNARGHVLPLLRRCCIFLGPWLGLHWFHQGMEDDWRVFGPTFENPKISQVYIYIIYIYLKKRTVEYRQSLKFWKLIGPRGSSVGRHSPTPVLSNNRCLLLFVSRFLQISLATQFCWISILINETSKIKVAPRTPAAMSVFPPRTTQELGPTGAITNKMGGATLRIPTFWTWSLRTRPQTETCLWATLLMPLPWCQGIETPTLEKLSIIVHTP